LVQQNGAQSLVKTAMDAVKAHIRDEGLHVGDNLPSEGRSPSSSASAGL